MGKAAIPMCNRPPLRVLNRICSDTWTKGGNCKMCREYFTETGPALQNFTSLRRGPHLDSLRVHNDPFPTSSLLWTLGTMLSAFIAGGVPRLLPAARTSSSAQHGAQCSRRPRTPTVLCSATPSVSPACVVARDSLLSSIRGTGRGVESPAETTAAVMEAIDTLVDACAEHQGDDGGDWVSRLAGRWRLLFSTETGLTALMGGRLPLVSAADVYQLVENGGALKVSTYILWSFFSLQGMRVGRR